MNKKKFQRFRYHCDVHGDNNTRGTKNCCMKHFQEKNNEKNSDKNVDKNQESKNSRMKK